MYLTLIVAGDSRGTLTWAYGGTEGFVTLRDVLG